MEKYLVIEPGGWLREIETEREQLLETFRTAIGCDCIETVKTVIPDICLIVDESGKVKTPPQRHNERASRLYAGYITWSGANNIAGPAILAAVHLVNGEPDLVPLNALELRRLTAYGIITD